jgi:DNA-directed RNA polymerase subunit L
MKLTKSQLKEIIREEIHSLLENKDTIFNSFNKDFKDVVLYAGAYLKGNKIVIYLDNDPNKEKNIINKLVRTKYSDKLKKVRSEDDVMIFKITESRIVENKSKEASMVLQLMDKDYSYSEALKATLKKYKNVDRDTLENELNKYI